MNHPKAVTYDGQVYLVTSVSPCTHEHESPAETYTLLNPLTGFTFPKCSQLVTPGDHRVDRRFAVEDYTALQTDHH